MSDLLKHILVADVIGSMVAGWKGRHATMATAFGLGIFSHAIMDLSEPDFTVNWFHSQQLKEATPFLGLQATGMAFVLRTMVKETRGDFRALKLRSAAIVGAVLPDVIDGIYALINPRAWYAGQMLFPWHVLTWQVNPMSMWATSLISGALMGARYIIYPLLSRLRWEPRGAGGS